MDTTSPHSDYGWLDDAALTTGLGLVLLGLVVMGVVETLLGSAHFTEHVPGLGVAVVHTSFNPRLRAHVIALGFLVFLAWGRSRVVRTILASLGPRP
ncbi:hypothetical protein DU500_12390 [Haloplanus rubicundus]|uniref:Uncharacterized protein n=1 Tax=Haloplanus rubicundus TaxID=1547898 RepID=A0A345E4N5_9EURY|nr:hypothetical protein [Haloplanus rubicundus]AXG07157.1 hypothetical protein DU500_12390 [Haloplanus rubicundus]